MTKVNQLLDKALSLPQEAGCYLMRDKNAQVIYVGKAKKLKSRVTSYFNQSAKSIKTEYMVSHVEDFDFIITRSDAESFVLENNLIKEHTPKYNIRLRDDKSYPYVQVNFAENFPRLEYVRRPKKEKKKQLFGPFPPGSNISLIMRVLTKVFQLRDCSLNEFKGRKTPCLYYQMKQCSAPCVDYISQENYLKDLEMSLSFFQSRAKAKKAMEYLKNKMLNYSENEEFEHAAMLRDHLQLLENFLSQSYDQKVESLKEDINMDVWSYWDGSEEVDLSIYMIRGGLLLGHKNFNFVKGELLDEIQEEVLQKIYQYYSDPDELIPEQIVVDIESNTLEEVEVAFKNLGIKKIIGKTKKYLPLIDMARKHAEETQRVRIENMDSVYLGLHKLKDLLNLKERPKILECYDIAIWQGQSPTAALIYFEEGKPDKTKYRYYHLEVREEGNNDFAMMREVISRRLKHEELPDVFVIDGGVAQVNTVLAVLKEFNVDVPVVGIAKSKDLTTGNLRAKTTERSDERLVIPGRTNPYILSKCPPLFKIIVSMRDEAHRFSRKLHHKAESKRVMKSWLDDVKGLNADVRNLIMMKLEVSKESLIEFSVNDLMNYFGIKTPYAKALWNYLHKESED